MAHLQDYKQQALLPPGQLDDLEQADLSPPGNVQDLWHAFWDSIAIPIGNYGDRAYTWLSGQGFVGSVDDMWYAYWKPNIINGGFDTDTDWTKGDGWTITGGVAVCDGTQALASALEQAPVVPALVPGEIYRVTFTIMNYAAGGVGANVGTALGTLRTADGTYTEDIVAGAANIFNMAADADFTGEIDNVSIRRVS